MSSSTDSPTGSGRKAEGLNVTVKETSHKDEKERKREKRLEANRKSAAASRKRRLDLIEELKKEVDTLTQKATALRKENDALRHALMLHPTNTALMRPPPQPQLLGSNPFAFNTNGSFLHDNAISAAGFQGSQQPGGEVGETEPKPLGESV